MKRHGFTMIEVMVVITIIAALVAVLIPAIGSFRRSSRQAAIVSFAGAIETGLTAYHHDYRDIPLSYLPTATPPLSFGDEWNGAEILAQAMSGPLPATDDGLDGYGFKSATGKKSGPYFDIKNDRNLRPSPTGHDKAYVFTMSYGADLTPFLYYRATPGGATSDDFRTARGLWDDDTSESGADISRFNVLDNALLSANVTARLDASKAYDVDASGNPLWPQEHTHRTGLAVQLRSADYLIVHAGADGEFGTNDDVYASGSPN